MKHTSQGQTPRVIVHRCSFANTRYFASGPPAVTHCPIQLPKPGRCALHNYSSGPDMPNMIERLTQHHREKATP